MNFRGKGIASTLSQIVVSQLNSKLKCFWKKCFGLPGSKVSSELCWLGGVAGDEPHGPNQSQKGKIRHHRWCSGEGYSHTCKRMGVITQENHPVQDATRRHWCASLYFGGSNRHLDSPVMVEQRWAQHKTWMWMKMKSFFFLNVWLGQRQRSSCQICPVWDNKLVMGQDTGNSVWSEGWKFEPIHLVSRLENNRNHPNLSHWVMLYFKRPKQAK